MLNAAHLVELLPVGLIAMPPVMLVAPKAAKADEKLPALHTEAQQSR